MPPIFETRLVAALLLIGGLFVGGVARAEDPAPPPGAAAAAAPTPAIEASDPDNCLLCHRFPGLSRLDAETGELRLFFVSERFYADGLGPHTSLACTACHARDAVEKVPHGDLPAVDCAQTCHLVNASGTVVDFSHQGPVDSLAKSVHAPSVLAQQPYESPLLRDGQSACLYCHDDPVYRLPAAADPVHRGVDPTVRCQTCHDQSLAVDVNRALRHVGSRLGDQRPAREAAAACAVCHSDPAVLAKNEMHDAVTSYMRSFHGKAGALGKLDAAMCVDCHSSEGGNPHLMLAADDPASPTHPDNRALTCLQSGCHDDAVPELGGAGVHMRIAPDTGTPESYVTRAFVWLTAGVIGLYYVLLLLELVNIVIRRPSDEHLANIALADALQRHPEGRKRLVRLDVHQRFQHWVLVISFLTLVITGLPMKFSGWSWMPTLVTMLGGLDAARFIHRVSAVVISVAFFYHLGYLAVAAWRDLARRRAEQPDRSLPAHLFWLVYESPMMVRPEDVRDFALLFLHLFGLRKHRPAQGRFHFSQKFEYWGVFWGMTIIGTSGAALWLETQFASILGGRALNFAYIMHSDEAFLALAYIAVVHFFAVMFSPAVFPLNLGSLTGDMPIDELADNHIGYLRQVAAELGVEPPKATRETGAREWLRQLGRRSFALVQATGIAAFAYFSLSFLYTEGTGGEPAFEVEEIPLRLDSSELAEGHEHHGTGAGGAARDVLQRGPVAHFHQIPTWYEADRANTCTDGGCHSALPHGDKKEVRAFLNMHTTFVDCQTCHLEAAPAEAALGWVSLADRRSVEPPAVIRLASLMEGRPAPGTPIGVWDTQVKALVVEAAEASGGDPELVGWRKRLDAARPGGVRYNAVLDEVAARIGRHGHGEYGQKIGLPAGSAGLWAPSADQLAAIAKLQGPEAAALHVDERKALVTTVHGQLHKPKVECSRCHTTEAGGLVDFGRLGYSPVRAQALRSNTLVKQAQDVEEGRSFFLPNVLGGTEVPPTEAPTGEEVTP